MHMAEQLTYFFVMDLNKVELSDSGFCRVDQWSLQNAPHYGLGCCNFLTHTASGIDSEGDFCSMVLYSMPPKEQPDGLFGDAAPKNVGDVVLWKDTVSDSCRVKLTAFRCDCCAIYVAYGRWNRRERYDTENVVTFVSARRKRLSWISQEPCKPVSSKLCQQRPFVRQQVFLVHSRQKTQQLDVVCNDCPVATTRGSHLSKVDFCNVLQVQWDVCKSPGFPSNRVAAGQVDPPALRITMVCSLFACCLSASEAFLFLSGAVCWVYSNAYTIRKNICWFFRG